MVQTQSKYVLCFLGGIRILICSKSSLIFLPAFPETKFLLKVVLYPGWHQSCQIACILFSWCTWHFTCVCCLCLLAIYEHAPAEGTEGHQSLVVSEPPHCFPTWPPISHLECSFFRSIGSFQHPLFFPVLSLHTSIFQKFPIAFH